MGRREVDGSLWVGKKNVSVFVLHINTYREESYTKKDLNNTVAVTKVGLIPTLFLSSAIRLLNKTIMVTRMNTIRRLGSDMASPGYQLYRPTLILYDGTIPNTISQLLTAGLIALGHLPHEKPWNGKLNIGSRLWMKFCSNCHLWTRRHPGPPSFSSTKKHLWPRNLFHS